ncbi:MAG: hypothetical protein ACK40X_12460, partial [Armatimonadota bacterium]
LVIAQAQHESEQMKANARRQVQTVMDEVEQIRQLRTRLVTELRHMLLSYLELLEKSEEVYETEVKPNEEPMD